ncbi:hypothetical protein [Pontibaca salina]|uniref:Tetratricopeptide repeat-like domain-containing protein n=1 Tax=Pontibaca salina TaxID=2795731 RepID=A0A934M079_9RHOB|nr:hypothetical protein [Pontibaca salina]MBI6628391.1 hypothetical protein [Pontibaca salina]
MSHSDSFIDEVTEEVRRDRLFRLFRRYGWIAVLLVLLVVGGAAFNEIRKAQMRTQAEDLGDALLAALENDAATARAEALAGVGAETPGGQAVAAFLTAAALADTDETATAVERLNTISTDGALPEIYRQIAAFKALTLQGDALPASERRLQFEALARPGAPLRLLAQEQLALIDIGENHPEGAIDRLQAILDDAEAPAGLQQRVAQVIVALGGTPTSAREGQG